MTLSSRKRWAEKQFLMMLGLFQSNRQLFEGRGAHKFAVTGSAKWGDFDDGV